ncbi:AsmA protein [Gammaproteobacteria bacterium]
MKKILVVIVVIMAVLVAGVLAAPALVPAEWVKARLVAKVKEATGRDLTIDGQVTLSILPTLGVRVVGVTLGNPPGFRSPELVRLGGLDAQIKPWPLLSGEIEIDNFVLHEPAFTLEVNRSGRGNWMFAVTNPTNIKANGPASATDEKNDAPKLANLRLGNVRIADGKLSYFNDKGTAETVEGIHLALVLNSLDEPLTATGGLTWHGQAVTLDLTVATPRALIAGQGSAVGINIIAEPLKLAFTGDLGSAGGVEGALEVASPSVRSLATWVSGKPVVLAGTGLGPLALKATVTAGTGQVALTQATFSLDAIKATGDLSVATTSTRPALQGQLNIETLDLNPYLPPTGQTVTTENDARMQTTAGHSDWSDAVIDASVLQSIDADIKLNVDAIKVRRIEVGRSELVITLHDGHLTADLAEMGLYQGKGVGRVALDGTQAGVEMNVRLALRDLQAETFLAAFGFDRLEGALNTELELAGHGASQRQIISSLGGKGTVTLLNGAIRGINLAAFSAGSHDSQKTNFSELSGSFSIAAGVVTNPDLTIKSSLLRVAGSGSVDLPGRTINYRIKPQLVSRSEGQDGTKEDKGLAVPVNIDGSWDALHFRPDIEAIADKAATTVKSFLKGKTLPKGLRLDHGKLLGR